VIRYNNKNGGSGITAYLIGRDFNKVRFLDGTVYTYNSQKPGMEHVENMKLLAFEGKGLSIYIRKNVKETNIKKENS